MKFYFIPPVIFLLLLNLNPPASSLPVFTQPLTGPSFAEISIVPLCYSDEGVILCSTKYIVNEMGAHRMMNQDFGYLLVSADGLWTEINHIHIKSESIS